ncbi:hypothetical protein ACRXCV_00525 (plasmid) [Halobacteriovorax sp. GFR7]|uniref:hypothetical protein n=1 Tax=unclassified Halobacteriovorax TaxID=2639665 RepID=UPI003D98DBBA
MKVDKLCTAVAKLRKYAALPAYDLKVEIIDRAECTVEFYRGGTSTEMTLQASLTSILSDDELVIERVLTVAADYIDQLELEKNIAKAELDIEQGRVMGSQDFKHRLASRKGGTNEESK